MASLGPAGLAAAGLGLASLLVLLAGVRADHFAARAAGKTTASVCFLGGAAACGLHHAGPAGLAITIGLWLSFVGDVLLLSDAKRVFLGGLGAFLLGHVAYAVGFVIMGIAPLGLGVGGVLLMPLAVVVWGWLKPHVGKLRVPVLAYITIISAMASLAVGAAWLEPSPARLTLLAAAVLFFVSDLFVARNRFIASTSSNRYLGLPLYYAAQWLFVIGAAP